jgi:hypothetical protein
MSGNMVWALAPMSAQSPAVARELAITASMLERMSAPSERMQVRDAMAQAQAPMSGQPLQASAWGLSRKTDPARKGSLKL